MEDDQKQHFISESERELTFVETVLELHPDKETVCIIRCIRIRMTIFDDEGLAYSCWTVTDLTP